MEFIQKTIFGLMPKFCKSSSSNESMDFWLVSDRVTAWMMKRAFWTWPYSSSSKLEDDKRQRFLLSGMDSGPFVNYPVGNV
mmetsp:Transcript_45705/g.177956  ORF Transcript_45705/g.177956 Transcript_45705/m.177956 type:complete len:81 (-) Transcript_45705:704-946(-)